MEIMSRRDEKYFIAVPQNLLQRIATLPNNVKPETLVNQAPWFIAYEDTSGNPARCPWLMADVR